MIKLNIMEITDAKSTLKHFSSWFNCFPVLSCWAVSGAVLASRSVMSPVLHYSPACYSVMERNDITLVGFSLKEALSGIFLVSLSCILLGYLVWYFDGNRGHGLLVTSDCSWFFFYSSLYFSNLFQFLSPT